MTSKLSFRSLERRHILKRIGKVKHTMVELAKAFSSYNDEVAKQRVSGNKLASELLSLSKKESPSLQDSLAKFSVIFRVLQDNDQSRTKRLDQKVISNLSAYKQTCKKTRAKFKKILAKKLEESIQLGRLGSIIRKKPIDWEELDRVQKETDKVQSRAKRAAVDLAREMALLETKKLRDIKLALKEFVNVELLFHVRALELFTEAYRTVEDISPSGDVRAFRDRFGSTLVKFQAMNEGYSTSKHTDPNIQKLKKAIDDLKLRQLNKTTVERKRQRFNKTIGDFKPQLNKTTNDDYKFRQAIDNFNQDAKKLLPGTNNRGVLHCPPPKHQQKRQLSR